MSDHRSMNNGIIPLRSFVRMCILMASSLVVPIVIEPLQATEPVRLRVLSYNIHHGEGIDGALDLERIARVIRSVEPDLVSLQEVDDKVLRSKKVDQPQKLGELCQMHSVFGKNIDLQGGGYGNAILSKYPILKSDNHPLPNLDQGESRGLLWAEIKLPNREEPLTFLATHFDHRPDPKNRVASAKEVIEFLAKKKGAMVLAGDLNAPPNAEPLTLLKEHWTDTAQEPLPTIPVKNPERQIDFILYRGQGVPWRCAEVRVLDESVASDHRPIFSILEWN